MKYLAIFVITLILTSVLSLSRIPGFSPDLIINEQTNKELFLLSYYSRLSHPLIGLSNNFATVLAFFPLIFYTHGEIYNSIRYKWLSMICVIAIFLTLSKGVIIAVAFTSIIYFSNIRILKGNIRNLLFALIVLTFFLYVYINFYPSVIDNIYNRFGYHSIDARYDIYKESFQLIQKKPIFGYGAGMSLRNIVDNGINVRNAHNTYIQQILYFGIPFGIIASLALFYLFFHFLVLAGWNRQNEYSLKAKTISLSIFGQLIIFLTETSFEGSVLRLIFYFSIAISVSLLYEKNY